MPAPPTEFLLRLLTILLTDPLLARGPRASERGPLAPPGTIVADERRERETCDGEASRDVVGPVRGLVGLPYPGRGDIVAGGGDSGSGGGSANDGIGSGSCSSTQGSHADDPYLTALLDVKLDLARALKTSKSRGYRGNV